jgi:hypothetical protein
MLQWEQKITLLFLAEPTNINFEGKGRGGAVMKWIDQAGYPWSSTPRGSWSYARVSRKGRACTPVYALNETGVSR